MSDRRLLIRVDGNETIGMGHVMRCVTLARMLRSRGGVEAEFVTRADRVSLEQIRRAGFPVHPLPVSIAGDAVLTDLRRSEPGALEGLASAGALRVVIDEWGNQEISADLLINGTVVEAWHRYPGNGAMRKYLGPSYALLDPSFSDVHRRVRQIRKDPSNLLIALGGDDPFHLTVRVMEGLERMPRSFEITVVIGPAFLDEERIRQTARISRHRTTLLKNIPNMSEVMCQHDLALTGGGLTALEVACTGTPALIVCEVDHQLETAKALEEKGAALNLGLGQRIEPDFLAEQVLSLLADPGRRLELSRSGRELIDGRGTERVTEILAEALALRGMG